MTYVIGEPRKLVPSLTNNLISSPFRGARRATMTYVSTNRRRMKSLPQQSLEQVENYCRDCKTPSPMVCVERCDIWKVKNETLEISRIVKEAGHTKTLLNAIKNARRLAVIDALQKQPLNIKELQQRLKKSEYNHSRSTITNAYLKPLKKAGLIKEDGMRYRLTFYGRKISEMLQKLDYESPLPTNSCCYEEVVMKELAHKPKTFDELGALVNPKSLSRVLIRLRRRGLIAKNHSGEYVFYHRVEKRRVAGLSPTEKRVFEAIPDEGIPARMLSKEVGITLRRTYKYLRRLKLKKLILKLRVQKTYELTSQGMEIAVALDEIMKLASQSLSVPIPVSQHSSRSFL